jgi:hypothetical protein
MNVTIIRITSIENRLNSYERKIATGATPRIRENARVNLSNWLLNIRASLVMDATKVNGTWTVEQMVETN